MNLQLIALPGTSDPAEWSVQAELAARAEGLAVTVSEERLVLKPGERAELRLTLTADGELLTDGNYDGWVVARSGEQRLRLPFTCELARTRVEEPDASAQSLGLPQPHPVLRRRIGTFNHR